MSASPTGYARAFVAACGDDAKVLEAAVADLATFATVFADSTLRAFFENPRVTAEAKAALLTGTVADASPFARDFVLLLADRRLLGRLAAVARAAATLADERLGRVTARIETAGKLSKDVLAELTATLEQQTGKTVRIETIENKALVSGIKVHLGDDVLDASLAGRLAKLARTM